MSELSPWQILLSVLPMYGLIILGGCFRKIGFLQKEADASLMKLIINVTYPCLIIDKILASKSVEDPKIALWTIPTGFIILAIGLFLSKFIGGLFRIPAGAERNTFATTSGIQNYGFAAVPIVIALFPPDLLGVLFVHSLGVEMALWTLGIATLQGFFPKEFRKLLSPPLLAVIIGLIFVYTGGGTLMKETEVFQPMFTVMNWLGATSFPLALLLVGASLADDLKSCIPTLRVAFASIFVRIIAMPLIILAMVKFIPFPRDLSLILIVQAAMPSAVMPIVLSRIYGGRPATAGQVVIATQAIGILTIPIWISLGLKLVGQ